MIGAMVAWRQNVLVEGRPALTAFRAASWGLHLIAHREARVRIGRDGPLMVLPPRLRHFGSTTIYMKREKYEADLTFLAGAVRSGDVVLDVGANFGIYSLVLSTRVSPGGHLFAFEPGDAALRLLRRNLRLNPTAPVTVIPKALSAESGRRTLSHVGGPMTFTLGGATKGESVPVTTLDEWWATRNQSPVACIKVDVEGHEPEVVAGGATLLRACRPLVMFEVSAGALARNGHPLTASWESLEALGYSFACLEEGSLLRISEVREGNLYAIPPGSGRWSALLS